VSFAIILRVASQLVFVVVVAVDFVIDSVRKLLDTPSYIIDWSTVQKTQTPWWLGVQGANDKEGHIFLDWWTNELLVSLDSMGPLGYWHSLYIPSNSNIATPSSCFVNKRLGLTWSLTRRHPSLLSLGKPILNPGDTIVKQWRWPYAQSSLQCPTVSV